MFYYVKIESKAETREDIKAEMAFYERGGEDEKRGERNHVRQHTQKRRPGTILDEGPSIHLSSLWPPLTQESTAQVSAVLGQPAPTSSFSPKKCSHAIISQSVQSRW